MQMQLEEIIAKRIAALYREKLDGEMRHIIKRNIMDSFASICGSLYTKCGNAGRP